MILLSCRVLRCDPNAKFQSLMFRRRHARSDVLFDFAFEGLENSKPFKWAFLGIPQLRKMA